MKKTVKQVLSRNVMNSANTRCLVITPSTRYLVKNYSALAPCRYLRNLLDTLHVCILATRYKCGTELQDFITEYKEQAGLLSQSNANFFSKGSSFHITFTLYSIT